MALGGNINVGPVHEILRDGPTRPQKAALDLGYVFKVNLARRVLLMGIRLLGVAAVVHGT